MGLSSTSCRTPAETCLTITHHRTPTPCFSKIMAKDINEPYEVVNRRERTIGVRLVFENIILVSTKSVSPDEVKYLQINIQKLPKNRTVTEETSERLAPTTLKDSEIIFDLKSEEASFDFTLAQDVQENASQYEIELEVMRKNELSRAGFFDVRLSDLDTISSSRKSKWRKISSVHKRFQTIELKYGIFPLQSLTSESPKKRKARGGSVISVKELKETTFDEKNPFCTSSKIEEGEEKTDGAEIRKSRVPNFQPGSCIMVGIVFNMFSI